MIRLIYSIAFYLILPLIVVRVFWRARKEPRYSEDLGQRLGFVEGVEPGAIWVHAVSAGETIAAGKLVKQLLGAGEKVVVSNMTPAGRERAEALFADEGVSIVYAPYDLLHGTNNFFSKLQPKALIIIDTELWPNMIASAQKCQVPVFLVNGRLSEKSATGYGRISYLSKPMFESLTMVFAQSELQANRFKALGCPDVMAAGSIKFDANLPEDFSAQTNALQAKFGERLVLLGASTHEGEEALLLDAFNQFGHEDHILVLALRHVQRCSSVEALIREKGFRYQLHSKGANLDPETRVYVVDTMGDLIYFYGICQSALVGGSLVDVGGHNPMEPASLGKPIMMGPYRRNIADIAELFAEQGGLQEVKSQQDILDFWQTTSEIEHAQKMSEAALNVVEQNRGALSRTLAKIYPVLKARAS